MGAPRVDGEGCGWPAVYPLQVVLVGGLGDSSAAGGGTSPSAPCTCTICVLPLSSGCAAPIVSGRRAAPTAVRRRRHPPTRRPSSRRRGTRRRPSRPFPLPPPPPCRCRGWRRSRIRWRRSRRPSTAPGGPRGEGVDAASAQRVYAGSHPSVAPVAPRGVPCRPVDAGVADTRSGRRGGLHGRPARLGLSSTARFHVRPRSAASGPTWTAIWGLVFGAVVSRLLPFYPQFPSGLWLSKQVYCCYLSPSFRPRPVRKPWKGTQLVHRGASLSFWDDRRQMCGPMCLCLYLVL